MKKFIRASESGFTIVELVVTIMVGGIFAASLSTLINENSHLSQRTRDLTVVNSFAEAKVEELRSIGFSALNDGTTDITAEMPSDLNSPRNASLQITMPSGGLKQAVINVAYYDQGVSRSHTYTTYIGELGVGQY